MRWTFSDGQLSLDHMRMQGTGANVELTGAVGLAPGVDSDLRIDGDFDLAALKQFRPMLTASGRSTIGVRLTGPLTDPSIQGEWVIQEAARQHERWREDGLGSIRISVNVSGQQFGDAGLPLIVLNALDAANSSPEALIVELTETVVMRNPTISIRCLQALRQMGIKLSIDDFGTGYSSLAYLKQLPIDELKIDRSFVKDLDSDETDRAIASSIIALAHNLGLSVVAEGVEAEEHLAFLRSEGCDEYQGYLFSRPVPPDAFASLLDGSRRPASDTGS